MILNKERCGEMAVNILANFIASIITGDFKEDKVTCYNLIKTLIGLPDATEEEIIEFSNFIFEKATNIFVAKKGAQNIMAARKGPEEVVEKNN